MPSPRHVANYPPEMLEVFRRASIAEVRIKLPTKSAAIKDRQKFYSLRSALRRENHFLAPVADQVTIKLAPVDPDNPRGATYLIPGPSDSDLVQAIRDANIALPTPDEAADAEPAPAPPTEPDDEEAPDLMAAFERAQRNQES